MHMLYVHYSAASSQTQPFGFKVTGKTQFPFSPITLQTDGQTKNSKIANYYLLLS